MSEGDNFGLNPNLQYYEIALDSLDNDGSYSQQHAATDWPQFRLSLPISNIAAIKVLQVEVPVTYYVINKNNNTFKLTESTGPTATVTIPVGNYMAEDLVFATKTALNEATGLNGTGTGHAFSGSYDPLTAKATYKTTSGHAFTLNFGAPTNSGNVNPRLWLGFNGGDITSVNGSITTPNVMLATGANYVYLNSRTIGTDIKLHLVNGAKNLSTGGKGPQMAKIPVNVNPNEVIYWNGFLYLYRS